jgi:hypothetical protein
MDYFTQKARAAARIVVADLRDIADKISVMLESIDFRGDSRGTDYERSSQQQSKLPVAVEVKLEKDQEGKRKAEGDRHYRIQNSIRKATWAAFVAATIYAGIAVLQWRANKRAAEATVQGVTNADKSFKQDERAWMAFKFVEGSITFTINKSFLVPTELLNTGKTPAKNVHGNIMVGVFEKGEPLDFSYSAGHANYKVQAGTIFPSGKIVESFEGIKHGQERTEPIIFTVPLKNDLFSAKSFIVVHGRIDYKDIFGIEHWTTYCRYVLHPELISEECTRYNDTDDNQ